MKHFRILIPITVLLLLFFPVRILQVAGLFLLFLMIVSWVLATMPRRALRITCERLTSRSYLHEKCLIRLTISNDSIFPIPLLLLKDETGGLHASNGQVKILHLPPRSQTDFSYEVWSSHRGLFRLGPLRMAASDPLGLFPWETDWNSERLVFVYPTISHLTVPTKHGQTGGPLLTHNPVFLDTTQLRSIRPYETGDDPRFMHWPATARTGQLQIKEFLHTLVVPFYIVLNLDDNDYHLKRKSGHRERCIEAAAAFAHLASTQGYALGFVTNGLLPMETHSALGLGSFDQSILHFPLGPATSSASFILSALSVIGSGTSNLVSACTQLAFHQKPRILIISPPLLSVDFQAICSLVPRSCELDFWFLDEHVKRENRIGHFDSPPLPGIRMAKIPEYGDELQAQEGNHA